jgi:hypothetical protein
MLRPHLGLRTLCVTLVIALLPFQNGCARATASDSSPQSATTIEITNHVLQSNLQPFGINLGDQTFYDSGQLLNNLIYRNPGFEGMEYRSIIRCGNVTATTCTDANPHAAWPADFWTGGSYTVLTGAHDGASGPIAQSSAPISLQFAGDAPASGDYVLLDKFFAADPAAGWWARTDNNARFSAETTDLSPHTPGKQALRMDAAAPNQSAEIASYFDTVPHRSFLQLHGEYALTFRAKSCGGNNQLAISFARAQEKQFFSTTPTLTPQWQDFHYAFTANDAPNSTGNVKLAFNVAGACALLDDVSLTPAPNPANPTAFRTDVVLALQQLRPGTLRYMASAAQLGSAIPNLLAPQFARTRAGYSSAKATEPDIPIGIPEFLELCDFLHADPWLVVPLATSPAEAAQLIRYLATEPNKHHPWLARFNKIHLELGNEAWNTTFDGAAITDSAAYGHRATEIFRAMRATPGFSPHKFDLVIGGQAEWPDRNAKILAAATGYDTLALAPYLMYSVNDASSPEKLFLPLFAQPEQMSRDGIMRQNADALFTAGHANLAIYETNLSTTRGTISQQQLDSFTPSLGAGLAVADHMLLMLRELGARTQMLFSLSQFQFRRDDHKNVRLWGAVVDMGNTNLKRPQFLALALANSVLRGDLLQTTQSGANPTWNQPRANDNVALDNAHEIQSFAFADGNQLALIVFNFSLDQPRTIRVTGPNSMHGEVQRSELTAASPSATNEDSDNVRIVNSTVNVPSQSGVTIAPHSMTVFKWQR